jgi:hypothetical protein
MMCGPREAGDPSSIECRFCKVSEAFVRFFLTKIEMPRKFLVIFPSRKFSAGHLSDSRVVVREEMGEKKNFSSLSGV